MRTEKEKERIIKFGRDAYFGEISPNRLIPRDALRDLYLMGWDNAGILKEGPEFYLKIVTATGGKEIYHMTRLVSEANIPALFAPHEMEIYEAAFHALTAAAND